MGLLDGKPELKKPRPAHEIVAEFIAGTMGSAFADLEREDQVACTNTAVNILSELRKEGWAIVLSPRQPGRPGP